MLHYQGQCTQGFIAPERLNNPQLLVSKAVDVYSVGMIFFMIFRRQNPSENIDRNAIEFCANAATLIAPAPSLQLSKP